MLKYNKYLVLGISKSGYSACNYLLENGCKCYIYEDYRNEKISDSIGKLIKKGAILLEKKDINKSISEIDVVIISPGVPINNEVALIAKSNNKKIISELEFGFKELAPINVCVTGTNGKTTTVCLISEILKNANLKSKILGNFGIPITSEINNIEKNTVCITEVSSFQMESSEQLIPNIACILNISPDHLERHYSMENYIFLKKRILLNQTQGDYAILNYDDEIVKNFADNIKSKIIYISLKDEVDGCYLKNNKVFFRGEEVIDINKISLKGKHNLYNSLFAIAVSKILCVNNEYIVKAFENFKGIPHRIELVNEINGIKIYNDSKATNTDSTINAISSINTPIVLILGGSEKGEAYDKLFMKIKDSSVSNVILTGNSAFNMFKASVEVGYKKVNCFYDFSEAVKYAFSLCNIGDSLLFSPACASFDNFNNYEERGDFFKKVVENLSAK